MPLFPKIKSHYEISGRGADQVIDYWMTRFEDVIFDVDVVFDGVGGETLERSWRVLKDKGRLVTLVSAAEVASDQLARDAFMLVRANGYTAWANWTNDLCRRTARFLKAVYPVASASGLTLGLNEAKCAGRSR